jgi:hypothetical protein
VDLESNQLQLDHLDAVSGRLEVRLGAGLTNQRKGHDRDLKSQREENAVSHRQQV